MNNATDVIRNDIIKERTTIIEDAEPLKPTAVDNLKSAIAAYMIRYHEWHPNERFFNDEDQEEVSGEEMYEIVTAATMDFIEDNFSRARKRYVYDVTYTHRIEVDAEDLDDAEYRVGEELDDHINSISSVDFDFDLNTHLTTLEQGLSSNSEIK